MKIIGILLLLWGVLGILGSFTIASDVGVACFIGAGSGLLSGIGFLIASKNKKDNDDNF